MLAWKKMYTRCCHVEVRVYPISTGSKYTKISKRMICTWIILCIFFLVDVLRTV